MLLSDGIFLYVTVSSSRFAEPTSSRWEFFTTIDFEWKYLNSEKKFKWPLLVRLVVLIMRRMTVVMSSSYIRSVAFAVWGL